MPESHISRDALTSWMACEGGISAEVLVAVMIICVVKRNCHIFQKWEMRHVSCSCLDWTVSVAEMRRVQSVQSVVIVLFFTSQDNLPATAQKCRHHTLSSLHTGMQGSKADLVPSRVDP